MKTLFYLFIRILFIDFREKEEGRETHTHTHTHWFVVPLIYAFMGWFLYVPWPGIEPATLAYWDDTLTNWATWPGPENAILKEHTMCRYLMSLIDSAALSETTNNKTSFTTG